MRKRFQMKIKDNGVCADSFDSDSFDELENRVKKLKDLKFK